MLFSNSFNQVIESNPIRILNESASYILKIQPHTKEFSIINSFKYTDIFNDSAIHIFPQDKLAALPDVFWNSHKEPKYPEGDIEFISKQLTTILELDN
ncbi:SRR1-like protein [Blattella germanica]|nr:SRR1-like protein [Blattella germanica]